MFCLRDTLGRGWALKALGGPTPKALLGIAHVTFLLAWSHLPGALLGCSCMPVALSVWVHFSGPAPVTTLRMALVGVLYSSPALAAVLSAFAL